MSFQFFRDLILIIDERVVLNFINFKALFLILMIDLLFLLILFVIIFVFIIISVFIIFKVFVFLIGCLISFLPIPFIDFSSIFIHIYFNILMLLTCHAAASHNNNLMKQNFQQVRPEPTIKPKKKKNKQLTKQQEQVLIQAFNIFDTNQSKSIDKQELTYLIEALGLDASPQSIQKIMEEVDQDGSGCIQKNQFIQMMKKRMVIQIDQIEDKNVRLEIQRVFDYLDDDNSGYIDFQKLKRGSSEYCEIDNNSLSNMIKWADSDGDGKVTKKDFERVMKVMKLI